MCVQVFFGINPKYVLRSKGQSKEIQASQSHFSCWENHGANLLGAHSCTQERNGSTKAKSHLTSLIVFCDKMTEFVGIIHLNSSRAFYFLLPHDIPVSNLGCHSLHG